MAFDITLFSKMSSSFTERKVATGWAYGPSTDNIATIVTSAFFNDVADQLSKGDNIYIVASDANTFRAVTSDTGVVPVTVAPLS